MADIERARAMGRREAEYEARERDRRAREQPEG